MCYPHAIENQQKKDSALSKPHAMEKTAKAGFWTKALATCNLKKEK